MLPQKFPIANRPGEHWCCGCLTPHRCQIGCHLVWRVWKFGPLYEDLGSWLPKTLNNRVHSFMKISCYMFICFLFLNLSFVQLQSCSCGSLYMIHLGFFCSRGQRTSRRTANETTWNESALGQMTNLMFSFTLCSMLVTIKGHSKNAKACERHIMSFRHDWINIIWGNDESYRL